MVWRKTALIFWALVTLIIPHATFGGISIDILDNTSITDSYQPDSILDGNTLLITFVEEVTSTTFKVFYLEADASKDFTDDQLTPADVRLADPIPVDSSPPYTAGLFPSIFTFSDGGTEKVGILFSGDDVPYFSVVDRSGTTPVVESVTDLSPYLSLTQTGSINGLSAVSDTDGRVHVLLSNFDGVSSDKIYYFSFPAKDPSTMFESGELDTSNSSNSPPHISISADSSGNAHLAWSTYADPDGNGTFGWFTYYMMADPDAGAGLELVLGKTLLFGQEGEYFVFPSISAVSKSEVFVSAQKYEGNSGDVFEPGELFLAILNPDLVPREGSPPFLPDYPEQIFTLSPKATGLSFLKPSSLADTEHRVHILGNGYEGTGITFASFEYDGGEIPILEPQKRVSLNDVQVFSPDLSFPSEGSSLAYITTGKAVVLFSGQDDVYSSHLYMTTTDAPAFPPQPEKESGCSISAGTAESTATGALFPFLLLAALYFTSRFSMKFRRDRKKR